VSDRAAASARARCSASFAARSRRSRAHTAVRRDSPWLTGMKARSANGATHVPLQRRRTALVAGSCGDFAGTPAAISRSAPSALASQRPTYAPSAAPKISCTSAACAHAASSTADFASCSATMQTAVEPDWLLSLRL